MTKHHFSNFHLQLACCLKLKPRLYIKSNYTGGLGFRSLDFEGGRQELEFDEFMSFLGTDWYTLCSSWPYGMAQLVSSKSWPPHTLQEMETESRVR